MTTKKAKEIGFTHKGLFYGFIPVYFELEEMNITGINLAYDVMLETLTKTHSYMFPESSFYISNQKEI